MWTTPIATARINLRPEQTSRSKAGCGTILTTLLNLDLLFVKYSQAGTLPKISTATWKNIHNIANQFVEEDQNFPYGHCQMENLQLNNETLKNALVYLIAVSNLPFAFIFLQSQEKIKIKYVANQAKLLFTQDAWTAPNYVGFMVEMANFIHNELFMRHLTLGVPQVQGICFSFQEATLFMDWQHNTKKLQPLLQFAQNVQLN
ncbi:uncharacterized protein VP01_432g13 [Puccinia sorghi]|uniref:HAT C-terminal dimerisation domain-containing protein n=1 Tax=Puccinia sorghi TaxID=27349 RepID=A0A0L6UPZ0_9BASI|nr:uncharacterized protein VP01_432g13 [Puccinia sorghi]